MARQRYREEIHSARRCALMFGGRSRSWSLSGCRSLSSIPPGPRFRERIIFSATTSRRFTRRKSLAFHRIAGLGLNRIGGRSGSFSLPHSLSFGRQGDFVSPVTIIAARTTKRFGPTPPACTVGEPRKSYWGERSFPLIMQNVHRYFLYLALFFLLVLAYDVWKALWFVDGFGIGIGTIVLAINLVLLAGYTVGCHSLRHLAGGFLDQFSKSPTCYRAYTCVSCFNRRHMLWAWLSLFWVGFADLYVRLCAMGVWHDWRLL